MIEKIWSVVLILLTALSICEAQGLRFKGGECPINDRTSLRIPKHGGLPLHGDISISFDFMMYPDELSGYLFRMGSGQNGSCPTIDLFYDGLSDMNVFELIWSGHRFISSLRIPKKELEPLRQWVQIKVALNPEKDSVCLRVGDRFRSAGFLKMEKLHKPEIRFGRSENLIDVPSFAMRNLKIEGSGKTLAFPLDENSGTHAESSRKTVSGYVVNPVWLVNDTFHWKRSRTFSSDRFLCVGYDSSRQEIYLFDKDSIRFLNMMDNSVRRQKFRNPCPVGIFLGSNFMDPSTGQIYAYEVYYPDADRNRVPSVAALDPETNEWKSVSHETLGMQMHHHDTFMDTLRRRFVIYGGFGNRRYNGDFYEFSLDRFEWKRWRHPEGDPVWPRYFSSMGYDRKRGKLYIYGGKGNETGDQIVGGDYMYNLNEIDPDSLTSRRLWDISWGFENCVAVRGMILVEDGFFYTLCYPESRTESELNLYRFSIKDGSHELLADPIPIYSDKITTNANLYYDEAIGRFIATVEESTDDINSRVTIYTLSFPARAVMKSTVSQRRTRFYGILLAIALMVLLFPSYFLALRAKRRKLRTMVPSYIAPEEDRPNSILLFGGFTAVDRNGEDISAGFTTKLRAMFLLILKDQNEGGITSRKLSRMLWPEKEEDKAKNIRGVTVNGLRKQLALLDGLSLVFKERKFRFEMSGGFYCDYLEFFRILDSKRPDMDKLIGIVSRGEFLIGETAPIFDKMKAEVERRMEPVMLAEMQRRFELKQFRNAITCADALLAMDPLNEAAMSCTIRSLISLDKEEEAVMKYRSFAVQYRKDYGEEYPKPYDQMVLHGE